MDPESVAFQPRDDFWRFQSEMLRVQQNQAELADRVARLERKQDDDSRLKNVWGTSSPFPSVLGGTTPQQVPLQQPTAEHFSSFDDHSSNLIGNLQLDADDEPRRVGTTSRANSVRFDETANHGHWAHASRTSLDLIPRTGSGLGGHALSERSYSYKSDGRQSSAGQSVYSATSGRANSLTSHGPTTPTEPPGPAPGLFILGSVPSIIRCWLNTNFKHNTLLYAAVCTGSRTSCLDVHLVEHLGFQDQVTTSDDGIRKIRLSVYLPEAVRISGSSSRSSSPEPQLPSVTVTFTIVDEHGTNPKGIQIFIGSDMLRAHNADILFSSNQLTLYDDDRSKLQIPLVRPEDEQAFSSLSVSHGTRLANPSYEAAGESTHGISVHGNVGDKRIAQAPESATAAQSSGEGGTGAQTSLDQRACPGQVSSSKPGSDHGQEPIAAAATARPGPSPAMLSSWRRDTNEKTTTGSLDWASVGKTTAPTPSYQRRDTGIKVLRPSKSGTRTLSTSTLSSATGQSRFYDDGKKRGEDEPATALQAPTLKRSVSGEQGSENKAGVVKARSANPVGGASAFAWLNSGANLRPLHLPLRSFPRAFPACLVCLGAAGSGQPPRFTTASTKKRRTVTPAQTHDRSSPHSPPAAGVRASASPPRFLPPHLHGEIRDASSQDVGPVSVRGEHTATGASSPSEAYANLSLDNGDTPMTRTPRASSPAKRLHSDMDDNNNNMDVDAPASSTSNTIRPPRSARATSVDMADAPALNGSPDPDTQVPSLDEQVATVLAMTHAPLQDQQEGYAISEKWLERVFSRTTEHSGRPHEFSKDAAEGPIGPVDNSDLVDNEAPRDSLTDSRGDAFVPLRKDVQLEQHFDMLPTKAWDLVVRWYGLKQGTPVIRRRVQNTVPDKSSENLQWELYPPVLTIRKVSKVTATASENSNAAETIIASRNDNYQSFLETAKKAAGIDPSNKVRVWRIIKALDSDNSTPQSLPQPQTSGMLTPDASPRGASPAATPSQRAPLVMDVASFKSLANGTERELVTGKDEKSNEESNPSLTLDGAGLGQDQVVVLEEHDDKGEYISDTVKAAPKKIAPKTTQSASNSGRSTPVGGPLTRGRTRNGKVRGHVGLTNLGNTCYMNSALQCLRSVEELSLYFLSGKWKEEVNRTNPIGHKGTIASSYAGVLDGIYSLSATSSFSPKQFKNTLGRANSLFSGYGQQDSQEFLSWLVDALHEDLNRIHDKPYRENPDSDDNTFRDPELIKELGETYRANHSARNHSVSTDLFNGFYKNTMVCPECEKVSITFDPYSQLTLQLPIEQSWRHTITYVPLYGKIQQLEVDIDKNASIKTLKEYVGKRFGGVKANRMMASEVYNSKFYRHLDDTSAISEVNITTRDDIYFYELEHAPSNWPAPKKKGAKYRPMIMSHSSDEDIPTSASPLHDKVVIPVFHRGPSPSSYRGTGFSMALWPFHIVVTREEARDYDTIFRKILAKVAQATTRPILTELGEDSLAQSRPGSDVVLTTEEDVSPNNDPRVKDGSIEGEDMVEVTMTDADTPAAQAPGQAEIAEVLRPGSFISPGFKQLFEIKHTRRSNEVVTTGWNTVDPTKPLEPITKRIPVPSTGDSEQSSPAGSVFSSSEEDGDSPQSGVDADAAIEEANVSSDEDAHAIERDTEPRGGRMKKKSKKAMKHQRKLERMAKYSKKNWKPKKGKVPEQPVYLDGPDNDEDGVLIRMGEALVLEWNATAFEALFGGKSEDDSRGMEAAKSIDTFDDPEIKEKKARRIARKKNGITLEECFMETSKSEVLSEDNAWYCSRCKELRRATKTLDIWTVPDILIIHLKRFSGFRSFRDKIEDHIDFPVEGLDLSGKVGFPEGKDLTYDLFAVDNHYGGLGGGHYTATAQNFFDKQWYDYNDSIVSKCSSGEKAVTRNAYLLFYRRRSSAPLGPPSLQEIVQGGANPDSDQDSESENRSGNGSRLGDSSRNGLSRAGAAGAGVGALGAGGSALSGAGTHHGNGVGAGNLTDDDPNFDDEGFDDFDDGGFDAINASSDNTNLYTTPLNRFDEGPIWSFDTLKSSNMAGDDSDDIASDAPNLGSGGGEDMQARLLEDFGDDITGHAGESTPVEGIPARLGGEEGDSEVAEIRIAVD